MGVGVVPWALHSYNSLGGYPLTGHKAEGFLPYTLPLSDTPVTPKNDPRPQSCLLPMVEAPSLYHVKKKKKKAMANPLDALIALMFVK